MLTLWATKSEKAEAFDKNRNVGLHHLALMVESFDQLDSIYQRLERNQIEMEFSPEPLRGGPARHMMCLEPSGIRIEFIHVPNS